MNELLDLTGQRFGKLTVLRKAPSQGDRRTRWECQCDCGNVYVTTSQNLRKGRVKSCGCGRLKDITNQRFGRLTAVERSDKYVEYAGHGRKYMWKCICDCGEVVYRLPEKLRNDVDSACENCKSKSAVSNMYAKAGFVEGTQLSKIAATKATAASKSGVRGVIWNKHTGKWRAALRFQGVTHYLGEYTEFSDAVKARRDAEDKYFAPILDVFYT